jgi:diguanylate cyclase (GGDEF)-like protein
MQTPVQNARILIADDTPYNLKVLSAVLSQQNYHLTLAHNGFETLKLAVTEAPDLILLDIMMPGMDGIEACQHLKQDPNTWDIPIIFLTAKSEDDDIIRGLELGAADYITKPFNPKILLARVRTHLSLRQKTKELQEFAHKDGLTLIANRRRFDSYLETEWNRCLRTQTPLSLVMVDIDFFKNYNDTYGHLQGDEILKLTAKTLEKVVENTPYLVARYGGEEFAIVLSNTPLEGAIGIAAKAHFEIANLNIAHKNSKLKKLTASFGIATIIPSEQTTIKDLINTADTRLFKAKENGRNCIKVYDA